MNKIKIIKSIKSHRILTSIIFLFFSSQIASKVDQATQENIICYLKTNAPELVYGELPFSCEGNPEKFVSQIAKEVAFLTGLGQNNLVPRIKECNEKLFTNSNLIILAKKLWFYRDSPILATNPATSLSIQQVCESILSPEPSKDTKQEVTNTNHTYVYFSADQPPADNIPIEAPLCYKFTVKSIEEQLAKIKNKYPNLYDYEINDAPGGHKILTAKRKEVDGKVISYFYSTNPLECNTYSQKKYTPEYVEKTKNDLLSENRQPVKSRQDRPYDLQNLKNPSQSLDANIPTGNYGYYLGDNIEKVRANLKVFCYDKNDDERENLEICLYTRDTNNYAKKMNKDISTAGFTYTSEGVIIGISITLDDTESSFNDYLESMISAYGPPTSKENHDRRPILTITKYAWEQGDTSYSLRAIYSFSNNKFTRVYSYDYINLKIATQKRQHRCLYLMDH